MNPAHSMLTVIAETVHRMAPLIDAGGLIGFGIAGIGLLVQAHTKLLRGIGWLLSWIAFVYLSRLMLAALDMRYFRTLRRAILPARSFSSKTRALRI